MKSWFVDNDSQTWNCVRCVCVGLETRGLMNEPLRMHKYWRDKEGRKKKGRSTQQDETTILARSKASPTPSVCAIDQPPLRLRVLLRHRLVALRERRVASALAFTGAELASEAKPDVVGD